MVDHVGWKPALTAALGKVGETLAVEQVTLNANLAYTLPTGTPAGVVHRVVFTQDDTGGHPVTYGPDTLAIDTTAGAATLVEVWPNGDVTYPGATGGGAGLDTEAVQDVVGAMVAAAGGSYNDAAGTITLPVGGGSSAITADDTPDAPAEGTWASYLVTSAVSWPEGLVWSTDPDGGVAPTVTGTALVSLFTVGGVTRAVMGATFPGVVVPDTVAPVAGTLASSSITETGFTLTVTGASDVGGLHAQPYSFDTGTGAFGAWQTPATLAVTGKTAGTAYTARHKVRDAAGNETTGASITVTTTAVVPDTTAPSTVTGLTATATGATTIDLSWSAATDNVGVTGYEYRIGGGAAVDAGAGTTETVTGLTAGTLYSFEVRAYDAAGNRSAAWSTAATATTTTPLTVVAADTFTRANSTTLGSTETGALAWSEIAGDVVIDTNALIPAAPSPATGVRSVAVIDAGVSDGEIESTINTHPSNATVGIVFRCADANNYLVAQLINIVGVNSLRLRSLVANTWTTIADIPGVVAVATTHTLKAVLTGPSVKVYLDGVLRIDVSTAVLQTATRHGLFWFSQASGDDKGSTVSDFTVRA